MTNEQINEAAGTNGIEFELSNLQIYRDRISFTLSFEGTKADIVAKIENEVTEEYIDLLIYRSIEENREYIYNLIPNV